MSEKSQYVQYLSDSTASPEADWHKEGRERAQKSIRIERRKEEDQCSLNPYLLSKWDRNQLRSYREKIEKAKKEMNLKKSIGREETKSPESEPNTTNPNTETISFRLGQVSMLVLIVASLISTLILSQGTPYAPIVAWCLIVAGCLRLMEDWLRLLLQKSTRLWSICVRKSAGFMVQTRGFGTTSGSSLNITSIPTTSTATEWVNELSAASADL